LAIVFTPNLISPPPDQYAQLMKDFPLASALVTLLIEHAGPIFDAAEGSDQD
jgi:hypothetical protein